MTKYIYNLKNMNATQCTQLFGSIIGLIIILFISCGGSLIFINSFIGRQHRKFLTIFENSFLFYIPYFVYFSCYLFSMLFTSFDLSPGFYGICFTHEQFCKKSFPFFCIFPIVFNVLLLLWRQGNIPKDFIKRGSAYCPVVKTRFKKFDHFSHLTFQPITKKNHIIYFLFIFSSLLSSSFFLFCDYRYVGKAITASFFTKKDSILDILSLFWKFAEIRPFVIANTIIVSTGWLFFFVQTIDQLILFCIGRTRYQLRSDTIKIVKTIRPDDEIQQ